jgi:H+/gluconate symporter-like permease
MKKLFKIIGSIILILIIAVVVFLYFVVLHYRKDNKTKAETHRQNSSSHQSNSLDSTAAVSFSFREITIISGTKRNLVQVEWAIRKYFIIRKRLKVSLMKMKTYTDSEKTDAIKKGNDYFNNDSWLIAPFKLRMLVLPEYRDAG